MGTMANIFSSSLTRDIMFYMWGDEVCYDKDVCDYQPPLLSLHLVVLLNTKSKTLIIARSTWDYFLSCLLSFLLQTHTSMSKYPDPASNKLLAKPKLTIISHCVEATDYIYGICNIFFSPFFSDLTGCALQQKVSGVLKSRQRDIPTALLQSELSLAQKTGGAEAKSLFLPRQQGSKA